jgi:acyl dehydratase
VQLCFLRYVGAIDKPYLDELKVGQQFVSSTRTLDTEETVRFAEKYDPQPFHLSEQQVQAPLFSRLVASGWHPAVMSIQLMVHGGLPLAGGIIGAGGELLSTNPVRPGDTLRVKCEMLEITPSKARPDRGTAMVRCMTGNARGGIVQSFTPNPMALGRPS